MSNRTFTLDEAQMLLPILESLLKQAINGKKLIEDVDAELQETAHRVFLNGGTMLNVVHLARRKAEREKAIRRIKDALAEIDATGVQVKDLDIGLLDFPCKVEGEVLLLCWKLGETAIQHCFNHRHAARHDIADDHHIRRGIQLLGPESFHQFDSQGAQLGAHRWIDIAVGAGHPVTRRLGNGGDTAHECPANSQYMNVHNAKINRENPYQWQR